MCVKPVAGKFKALNKHVFHCPPSPKCYSLYVVFLGESPDMLIRGWKSQNELVHSA